jgi:hypothetical protein
VALSLGVCLVTHVPSLSDYRDGPHLRGRY